MLRSLVVAVGISMSLPSVITGYSAPIVITAQEIVVEAPSIQYEYGIASYYANKFDGRLTASGTVFRNRHLTAAHRTLPFGTYIKVTNLDNGREATLVVRDRGPFIDDRILDLSQAAARKLGIIKQGLAFVSVEIVS